MSKGLRFTERELEYIKVHSQDMSIAEIATALGRNYWAVQRIMQNKSGENLTDNQKAFIDAYKNTLSVYEMANRLKVGYAVIFGYLNKRVNVKQNHVFTADEDFIIRQMYGKYRAKLIATKIGVDEEAIYNRARKLGLKKNKTQAKNDS